jgi:hypothetical protein
MVDFWGRSEAGTIGQALLTSCEYWAKICSRPSLLLASIPPEFQATMKTSVILAEI